MNQAIPVNGLSLDQGLARFCALSILLPFVLFPSFASVPEFAESGTTKTGKAVSFDAIGKSGLAGCSPRFSHDTSEKIFFPA